MKTEEELSEEMFKIIEQAHIPELLRCFKRFIIYAMRKYAKQNDKQKLINFELWRIAHDKENRGMDECHTKKLIEKYLNKSMKEKINDIKDTSFVFAILSFAYLYIGIISLCSVIYESIKKFLICLKYAIKLTGRKIEGKRTPISVAWGVGIIYYKKR